MATLTQVLGQGSAFTISPAQGATLLNAAPTVSTANSPVSIVLAGASSQRISIRTIAIKATGAAASASITVQDGASVILDLGTVSFALGGPAILFSGTPLATGSIGNSMTINVSAGGALAITTTSVIADRQ
jgi:hypothetical protein